MSFEEEVREVVKKARAEKAQYEKEGRDFADSWNALRESFFWPLFHRAKTALEAEGIIANPQLVNGSIVLEALWNRSEDSFVHALRFRADNDKRLVVCSSSLPNSKEESFTLDHLNESMVRDKIKQFAAGIARGDSPHRLVY